MSYHLPDNWQPRSHSVFLDIARKISRPYLLLATCPHVKRLLNRKKHETFRKRFFFLHGCKTRARLFLGRIYQMGNGEKKAT